MQLQFIWARSLHKNALSTLGVFVVASSLLERVQPIWLGSRRRLFWEDRGQSINAL